MTRRIALFTFIVLLLTAPLFARRRAITPGNPNHCVHALLSAEALPLLIEVSGGFVYWVDELEGAVRRVSQGGGATEELAVLDEWLALSMAVDDMSVYIGALPFEALFTPTAGVILVIPKGGGVVSVLESGVLSPFDVEVDATHVYWAAAGLLDVEAGTVAAGGKIERVTKNGVTRQTLAENLSAPLDLTLEGNDVFYGETGLADGDATVGVYRVSKSGGAVTTIDDDTAAAVLEIANDHIVVWGGNEDLENAIFVAKGGSSTRTLVVEEFISGGPRILDGRVYYLTDEDDTGSTLWSVAIGGGTPVRVRDGLAFIDDFEIDACAATFGTVDGQLVSEGT